MSTFPIISSTNSSYKTQKDKNEFCKKRKSQWHNHTNSSWNYHVSSKLQIQLLYCTDAWLSLGAAARSGTLQKWVPLGSSCVGTLGHISWPSSVDASFPTLLWVPSLSHSQDAMFFYLEKRPHPNKIQKATFLSGIFIIRKKLLNKPKSPGSCLCPKNIF